MIKEKSFEQGSGAWHKARKRLITASNFSRIITPKGKKSTQSALYMDELLGLPYAQKKPVNNYWMQRGVDMESKAREFYENECIKDKVEQVGLIYKDEKKLISCSPDGMRPDRGLEIKCPKDRTHINYLRKKTLPTVYIPQVQGSMWITGFQCWDFVSYHPEIKPMWITIERDEEYQKLFTDIINDFIAELVEKRTVLSL